VLCFVGPVNWYVQLPGVDEDSFRLNVPSGVLPSGDPVVEPSGAVTKRLTAVPVGSPTALTTYVAFTAAGFGLIAHDEPGL